VLPASNGLPRPRLALKPPAATPMPKVPWALPPLHAGASGAGARSAPVLQVTLPPETDGGDLELQVLVRRKGVVVAEALAALPGTSAEGAGTLSIEFKRS
jgi:hypothetical protein